MYRNYLVTAARNLAREKLYSFINISGLAVGLTCAIFIVLFFRDEISFDGWIPASEHLYRTEMTVMIPGRDPMRLAVSPFPMPSAMQDGIPEITGMTRVYPEQMTVTRGDRHFYESVDLVDPSFFQVIELPLVAGDPTTVLSQPESIVLSQTMARKYFGVADPLGQTLTVSANVIGESGKIATHVLTVTGVLRDLPHNTHLVADFVVPNSSRSEVLPQSLKEDWTSQQGFGYVRLAPDADPRKVLAKTRSIIDRVLHEATDILKVSGSEFEQPHLTPFKDLHLTTDNYTGGGMRPPGSWTTLYGFAVIALLIVLVACFNFMNMATARATLRAREISLRKTVGATRGQLVVQFLGEAVLTALIALVVALALVEILLMLYVYNPDGNSIFSVRVHGPGIRDTLDFIDRTWRSFAPTVPVHRYFLSEAFDNLFKEDERQARMFSLFVGIAIFIACLGLFGLAAFTAQRRTKEIGVRKVFGACQTDIVRLLLWQFSVPVLIANLIAWPVAYYYLHHWLESYAFRMELSPVYFVLAGAAALVIAWSTVIAHALRVARANPIHALRYE